MFLTSLITTLLTFLAWLASARLSSNLADAATHSTAVWLATGVSFGLLLVVKNEKRWPTIWGIGLAGLLWTWLQGKELTPSIAFSINEVLTTLLGAWISQRLAQGGSGNRGPVIAYIGLLVGAAITALSSATLALALWRWVQPQALLSNEWRVWACSTFVGIVLIAPMFKAFANFRAKRSGGMPMGEFLGGAATLTLFFAVAALIFSGDAAQRFGASLGPTLAYLPMPFMVMTAVMWGERGAMLSMFAAALALIAWTNAGGGPFAELEGFRGEAVVEVQGYVAVLAILVGVVTALDALHARALSSMRAWRLAYQQVLAANQLVVLTLDAVKGRAYWSEGAEQLLHTDVTQLTSVYDLIAQADAAEQPLMQRDWLALTQGQCERVRWQHELRCSDGHLVPVDVRLCALRGGDSKVEQVVALMEVDEGAAHGA